jgi:hypothetical protein
METSHAEHEWSVRHIFSTGSQHPLKMHHIVISAISDKNKENGRKH